ncbi:MAG TPA: tRNA (adenosine(37)-N6)-threonylcarbamoyltransferase complex ATPase subunit type 1 TsaE [bacterium]|nr:tRNA (adenosine(37)-N6)-threonylcarbamoyltransferase complex ATPase subunit type 1 TsaE [bacterium]
MSVDAGPGFLEVHTGSPDETRALGEALGRLLRARDARGAVVGLTGPLGAGKTCFVQGLARGLGAGGYVRSPTFVLVHRYPGPLPLYHVDLYRIAPPDLDALGLEEIIEGDGITAIEWAGTAPLPPDHLSVELSFDGDENARTVRVGAAGGRSRRLLDGLRTCVSSR